MTLAAELNARAVDTDGVHQAVRYYLAEQLDDLPHEDMLDQLYEAAGRPAVDAARADLVQDPILLEGAALDVLTTAWVDNPQRLRAVLAETKGKMPVVEVGIIAITVMFGIYLAATKGVTRSKKVTTKKPDGTFEETEEIDRIDPSRSLSAVVNIFRQLGQ